MDVLNVVDATVEVADDPCCSFLDLTVNSEPLRDQLGKDVVLDGCTPLRAGWPLRWGLEWLDLLLDSSGGELPDRRVALFVCKECGDLGCGALSVDIERVDSSVRWREFGWEDSTDERFESTGEPREFTFEAKAYDRMLQAIHERVLASRLEVPASGHLWWRKEGISLMAL